MKRPFDRLVIIIILLAATLLVLPGATSPPAGILLGVAANPLAAGQNVDAALADFEAAMGRPVDIVHYYKRGQDNLFPRPSEISRAQEQNSPRILFFNWKADGLTWQEVANGAADDYLRRVGQKLAHELDGHFFFSVNAEMEDEVDPAPGSGQTASDFRNFFRHVILTLREANGRNLMSVMGYTGAHKWSMEPWFSELYPGDDVVDWIAQDPFAIHPRITPDMAHLVNRPAEGWPGFYEWAVKQFPTKPQMLAEWGVAESVDSPTYKADFFETAAEQLAQFPRIRALVYWNHKGQRDDGEHLKVGTTAIDSNADSLDAYRTFVNSELFMHTDQYAKFPD